MPSHRRTKLILLSVFLLSGIILYCRFSPLRDAESPYLTKLKELAHAEQSEAAAANEKMQAGLKAAEDEAKAKAQQKAGPRPDSPSEVQAVMKDRLPAAEKEKADAAVAAGEVPGKKVDVGQGKMHQDKETHVGEQVMMPGFNANEEIARILKQKTIVIFSKTYCPYSKKAKHVLLDKYKINPPPFVVELDEHPHGAELQEALGKVTGRKTVPNVLIAGTSIGGGDDVVLLDEENKLADTIRKYGGKRILQIFREKAD